MPASCTVQTGASSPRRATFTPARQPVSRSDLRSAVDEGRHPERPQFGVPHAAADEAAVRADATVGQGHVALGGGHVPGRDADRRHGPGGVRDAVAEPRRLDRAVPRSRGGTACPGPRSRARPRGDCMAGEDRPVRNVRDRRGSASRPARRRAALGRRCAAPHRRRRAASREGRGGRSRRRFRGPRPRPSRSAGSRARRPPPRAGRPPAGWGRGTSRASR